MNANYYTHVCTHSSLFLRRWKSHRLEIWYGGSFYGVDVLQEKIFFENLTRNPDTSHDKKKKKKIEVLKMYAQ